MYYRFLQVLQSVTISLQGSLLIQHPVTQELLINIDPQILLMIRESDIMAKLNMDIPLSVTMTCMQIERIKPYASKLRMLIIEYNKVSSQIPVCVSILMRNNRKEIECVLARGLTELNWLSVNVEDFLDAVDKKLEKLVVLLKMVTDILDTRINVILMKMS